MFHCLWGALHQSRENQCHSIFLAGYSTLASWGAGLSPRPPAILDTGNGNGGQGARLASQFDQT
jgi:hypothetical protein